MEEIWRSIKDYEGLYEVSNWGRVRNTRTGRVLKPRFSGYYHYYCVNLSKNGEAKNYLIHRLVAEAFVPNPYKRNEVDHINNIKTDNRADNLQWIKHKENCEKRNNTTINKDRIVHVCCFVGNKFFVFESLRSAERITGVSHSNIQKCLKGIHKQTKNHKWYYFPLVPPKALPYFEALPRS